jgi:hypothetical protein
MEDVSGASSAPAEVAAPVTLTAVEQAAASGDVASYRQARRAERVGTPLSADQPAASATAQPADQAASTEASSKPASEPAKPKRNADTRVQELLADRARLQAELDAARRPAPPHVDAKPAASSPAPAPESFPKFAQFLETHPDADLETWMEARDDWRDQRNAERSQEAAKIQHEERWHAERATNFNQQLKDAAAADASFREKLSPDVATLEPAAIAHAEGRPLTINNGIAEEIIDSPIAAKVMLHLSEHPDELQTLRQARSPRELARRFGALEDRLQRATSAAPPPLNTVTKVPTPPTTLGTRPAAGADPVVSAVRSGDVAAYRAARLAERVAGQIRR